MQLCSEIINFFPSMHSMTILINLFLIYLVRPTTPDMIRDCFALLNKTRILILKGSALSPVPLSLSLPVWLPQQ